MTKDIYKDIDVNVSGQDLLDMFREVDYDGKPEHESVRLEINEDGEYHFVDDNWDEDDDTIYTQIYERSEWLEDPNEEVIMEYWVHALNEFYRHNPIEIGTDRYTKENEEEYIVEHKRLWIAFY
ncbi:hypothetical protein [uncultured Anaerococcus sp.]|uniref:hypothetical protein n=1 Tax=uncultured Anaerococcus sp. TaxID=293428 RepID=UPI002889C739|nr:hypothetical protein [uncultured Anaerococcus sp.]